MLRGLRKLVVQGLGFTNSDDFKFRVPGSNYSRAALGLARTVCGNDSVYEVEQPKQGFVIYSIRARWIDLTSYGLYLQWRRYELHASAATNPKPSATP